MTDGPPERAWYEDELSEYPDVVEELSLGEGIAAHKLLKAHIKRAGHPGEKARLKRVATRRSRFGTDGVKPPGLSRINGIGSTVIGKAEFDPESGSYIKTRWFTFAFIPIVPLDAWLVTDADEGWYFHAKVPMGESSTPLRVTVGSLVALLALLIAWVVWHEVTHDDVYLVNGLDEPLMFEVAGDVFDVGARQHETIELGRGEHLIRAFRPGGPDLDADTIRLSGRTDFAAFNPLGAANLVLEKAVYAENPTDSPPPESLAGSTVVTLDDIDYVMREAPMEIEMPRGKKTVTKQAVHWPGGGWTDAADLLAANDRVDTVGQLAANISAVYPDDTEAVDWVAWAAGMSPDHSWLDPFLDRRLALLGDDYDAHRELQLLFEMYDALDALLPAYRARSEAAPNDADAAILLAWLLPNEEAYISVTRSLAGRPEHVPSIELMVSFVDPYLDAAETVDLCERAAALGAPVILRRIHAHGTALAVLGRPQESAKVLADGLRDVDPEAPNIDLVIHTYAAARHAAGYPDDLPTVWKAVERLGGETWFYVVAQALAQCGGGPEFEELEASHPDGEHDPATRLIAKTRLDLEAALTLAHEVEEDSLWYVDDMTQLRLACAAGDAGDAAFAEFLHGGLTPAAAEAVRVTQLTGEEPLPVSDERLRHIDRAALHLAAAARTSDEEQRAFHLAEAKRLDVFSILHPR